MAASTKDINPTYYSKGLKRDISTSGTVYTLIPSRNAFIPVPPSSADTLIFSLENLSQSLAEVRCQSKSLFLRSKLPVAPGAFQKIYLPFTDDWEFSVDAEFKVSSVQALTLPPADPAYSSVLNTQAEFRLVATNGFSKTTKGLWSSNGLINIVKKQSFTADDYISLSATGRSFVVKYFHQLFWAESSFSYLIPASEFPEMIQIGSENPVAFSLDTHHRLKANPAYVAPEAVLWNLENESAHS